MPNLSDIPKNNPFGTPNGYFDNFSRDLESKIAEKRIAEKCGKKLPFTHPMDYFEELTEKLSNKTYNKTDKRGRILRMFAPYAAAAAGLILIFSLWNVLLQNKISENESTQYAQTEQTTTETEQLAGLDPVSTIIPEDADTAEVALAVENVLDDMAIIEIAEISFEQPTDTIQQQPGDDNHDRAVEEYLMEHAHYSDFIAEL